MKLWMKLLLTGAASFAGGFALGYLVRKKTGEVEIEEVSEEELEKLTEEMKEKEPKEENTIELAPVPADEKEAYFKRWKEEGSTPDYDTRTKDSPDDVVVASDVTDEDLNSIEDYLHNLKDVEAGTMADWLRYVQSPEGEYDTVELIWYEKDDVVCDEDDEPLEDSEKFMGFDVNEQFQLVDPETTGDENVRVIFNHKTKSLYYITRVPGTAYSQMAKVREMSSREYDDEDDE